MAVYFIQAGDGGPVKIGVSDAPDKRLLNMQSNHYDELVLLRTIPGHLAEERWLHWHYRSHQIRAEWFQPCPSMLWVEPKLNHGLSMHPLALYRARHGLTMTQAARLFNISTSTVCIYEQFGSVPGKQALARIVEATKGELTRADFTSDIEPQPRAA